MYQRWHWRVVYALLNFWGNSRFRLVRKLYPVRLSNWVTEHGD